LPVDNLPAPADFFYCGFIPDDQEEQKDAGGTDK
jgi:hypothetical protein